MTTTLNRPTVRTLPNGLTIVAEQMPVEAVNLNIYLNVGSFLETDGINGMAHFLEHMVFKGTSRLAAGEFERLVEERGAVTNAATSQDYTHYYITTAPKDFAALAPLQIDVVTNPRIPEDDFAREKLVVLEEIRRSQDNSSRRIYQQAIEVAFAKLAYRRPVLGPEAVIEGITAQQMRFFHATHYQPTSMTAVAVGNLPVEELIDIVTDGFASQSGSMPAMEFVGKKSQPTPEPAFNRIVRREYIDPSLQQARLIMVWRVPGLMHLSETYPLDILAAILGSGRTSRLVKELREERQLVNNVSVSNMSNRIQGLFYLSAQLPSENIAEVEQIITQHIFQLQHTLATESEISRIRRQVANRYIFGTETPSDRADLYGYYRSVVGDLSPALNYPQQIQALDAKTLQLAARQYLSPNAYGIITVKPE
ncbi:M16 family metallopeptidase [Chamaesiphon polymorphus]|uniref:Peptidase M16 n=1 Tax=Chamaesiphon polymorphus CCALA 037 TaxID=2107692 RepID=A0A2T1GHY4_9CYAN|nr:pitrilysin family protein [Chamaesiphon polymorphus]PSB57323.1 peptidase M16 [Chamaesiphon polymorphus CCALA 037]